MWSLHTLYLFHDSKFIVISSAGSTRQALSWGSLHSIHFDLFPFSSFPSTRCHPRHLCSALVGHTCSCWRGSHILKCVDGLPCAVERVATVLQTVGYEPRGIKTRYLGSLWFSYMTLLLPFVMLCFTGFFPVRFLRVICLFSLCFLFGAVVLIFGSDGQCLFIGFVCVLYFYLLRIFSLQFFACCVLC